VGHFPARRADFAAERAAAAIGIAGDDADARRERFAIVHAVEGVCGADRYGDGEGADRGGSGFYGLISKNKPTIST
jgi:hypothetical protein